MPEIRFASSSIRSLGKSEYIVSGMLVMHGISKQVELPLKRTGQLATRTQGFSIRYKLNRLHFDVGTTYKHTIIDRFVADEVEVEIDLWTRRAPVKK